MTSSPETNAVEIAARVTEALLKRLELPDDIARLIYYSIIRTYQGSTAIEDIDELVVRHTVAYHSVLSRVLSFPKSGPFKASIYNLAQLSLDEYSRLAYGRSADEQKRWVKGGHSAFPTGLYYRLLDYLVPFSIPERVRFEHTHVLGATGSGKTQLLQHMICADAQTDAALIVMAPKGNLLSNIAYLESIPADRITWIRPQDFLTRPLKLNVFQMRLDPTAVVEIVNFAFASKDAATTAKQTTLLNYCVRLLCHIPGATFLTLRSLMKCDTLPAEYEQYLRKLSGSAQEFFRSEFANKKTYGETKDQMVWRIDSLCENTLVETLLSQKRNTFDVPAEIEAGRIILFDTSIKLMGEAGSAFLGRLFLQLVAQAAKQRDTDRHLRPCYFYIDECATYLSEDIEGMLERSREARVGLILAHQQLQQLRKYSSALEESVHTNTSIKIVGSVSADDSRKMAAEVNEDAEILKDQLPLTFRLRAKGFLRNAVAITVTPGTIENMPRRSEHEIERMLPAMPDPPGPEETPEHHGTHKKAMDDSHSDIE